MVLRAACESGRSIDFPDSCWVEQPAPEQTSGLCETCAHLDFWDLLVSPSARAQVSTIKLLSADVEQGYCSFCRLLWRAALLEVPDDWIRRARRAHAVLRVRCKLHYVPGDGKEPCDFGGADYYIGSQLLRGKNFVLSQDRD